jgi:hypothetical protein
MFGIQLPIHFIKTLGFESQHLIQKYTKKSSVASHVILKFEMVYCIYYIQNFVGDEVTSFEKLREFQSVLPLSLTDPVVAEQKLKKIQVKNFPFHKLLF